MTLALSLLLILISLTVHEFAHALTALFFGDNTAKKQGRMTLNPLKHIDPFGTVILPLILASSSAITGGLVPVFGYAKPVPVNFCNLKPRRLGMILVALAGPLSNVLLAFASVFLLFQFQPHGIWKEIGRLFFSLNLLLAIFNLVPIPPLDGARIVSGFLPEALAMKYNRMEFLGFILILILLQTHFFNHLYQNGIKLFLKGVSALWKQS